MIAKPLGVNTATNYPQPLPIGGIREQHHLASAVVADADDELRIAQLFAQSPVSWIEKNVRPVDGDAVANTGEPACQQRNRTAVVTEMIMQMSNTLPPHRDRQEDRFLEVGKLQSEAAQAGAARSHRQHQAAEIASGPADECRAVAQDEPGHSHWEQVLRLLLLDDDLSSDLVLLAGPSYGKGAYIEPSRAQPCDLSLNEGVGGARIEIREITDAHEVSPRRIAGRVS